MRVAPAARRTATRFGCCARSTRGSCRSTSTRSYCQTTMPARCLLVTSSPSRARSRSRVRVAWSIRRASRRSRHRREQQGQTVAASAISSTRPRTSPASRAMPARPAYAASRGETIRVIPRLRGLHRPGVSATSRVLRRPRHSPRTRCTQSSGRTSSCARAPESRSPSRPSGTTKSRPETAAFARASFSSARAAARARSNGKRPRCTRCRDEIDDVALDRFRERAPARAHVDLEQRRRIRRPTRARARPRRGSSRRASIFDLVLAARIPDADAHEESGSSCASGSGYVPSYSIGFCVGEHDERLWQWSASRLRSSPGAPASPRAAQPASSGGARLTSCGEQEVGEDRPPGGT